MGIFSFFKKEKHINHLVRAYRMVYGCSDMTAIHCLRHNYTEDELRMIRNGLEIIEKGGDIYATLMRNPPFKEERNEVFAIEMTKR